MRRPRNSVDEAIKKLSLSSTGEHQTQTTKLPPYSVGAQERSIFRMILYLFIFPNNSLPFLNEKHFEIIHLFRANDSTTARHFFVFSAKQCGKSAALGVSWELLLLEVCDEQGMVRDGREHYHFCPRECSLSLSMQVISGTKSTKKIIIKKT